MIRLRIERFTVSEIISPHDDTLIWFEDGQPVGRAIIEQEEVDDTKSHPKYGEITSYKWVPVEVIDE